MTTGILADIYSEIKLDKSINLSLSEDNKETALNSRGVYALHNIETGGLYIGSTNRTLKGRILEHKNALDERRHTNWRMANEYDPSNTEVRILTYTTDDLVPEYVIEVLEQLAISAFPLDILYNQNLIYPKNKQIEYIESNHKELLYILVNEIRDIYAWQLNQCVVKKKEPRMLLSTLLLGSDSRVINPEVGMSLTAIE